MKVGESVRLRFTGHRGVITQIEGDNVYVKVLCSGKIIITKEKCLTY